MITNILLASILLLILIVLAFIIFQKKSSDPLLKEIVRLDSLMRDEFSRNREEFEKSSKNTREEIGNTLKNITDIIAQTLKSNEEKTDRLTRQLDEKITFLQQTLINSDKESRKELSDTLKSFEEKLTNSLNKINETIEKRLALLQEENSKKLEEMRATVDEKLQKTLEIRLTESFKQVSERLEQVHVGLGEMKNLAAGVGDLKKVLSNVKQRGILGEIQLANILENILSPEQYETNVVIKTGTRENVEFVIKLPGKDDTGEFVLLPIDSKFPIESYHLLLDAYDNGNADEIKAASKNVENEIKRCAKEIRSKYIEPPKTTDFGILFLPFEGLYAEVVRQTSLIEELQRDFKIIVTGPTTLAAFLNSLQMGFRTLTIQKRTSEVWKILGAIKTEFSKFGDVLKKAQEKINKASEDIDLLVGTRTKQIQTKLRNVESLSDSEAKKIIGGDEIIDYSEENEQST